MKTMLQLCMARLHLVKEDQPLRNDPLDDHEINLNRFDALIDSLSSYEDPDSPYYYLMATVLVDIIKAKHIYLAWIDEEI